MTVRLVVDNLPLAIREEDLDQMFSLYGRVLAIYLSQTWESEKQSLFALVDMHSPREADEALLHLNNSLMGGRAISVVKSRSEFSDTAPELRRAS